MKKIILIIIIVISGFSLSAQVDRTKAPESGPAPEIKFGQVESFKMDNGLTVIVVENHKLPRVRADIYFDYPPVSMEEKVGLKNMFGEMLRSGTENYTKEKLDEESEFLGTALFTGSRMVGVSALKRNLTKSVELLSEVLLRPTFNNEKEFTKLIKQSFTALEASDKNSDAIMGRVYNALLYGKSHPYGEFETEKSLENIILADFKKFYDQNLKPNASYLTFVGDITVNEAKKLADTYFSSWEKGRVPEAYLPEIPDANMAEIVLVDLPSSTQANVFIANLTDLKKSNPDFHAANLGNQILGGGSFGRLFQNIREDKGYTYGAYSQLHDDRYIGEFVARAKVRNNVVDSAVTEFIKEFTAITSEKVSEEDLQIKKTERTGIFALQMERPEIIARLARTELMENLDKGYYADYLKNMNAVITDDVLVAIKKHIRPENVKIFVVGKAEEVLPRLKNLNYPINFYDKWANETTDPTAKKNVGNITAKEIIENYLEAIGGKKKLKSVKTSTINFNLSFPGQPPIIAIDKSTADNKSNFSMYRPGPKDHPTITGPGFLIFKDVFDGENGYQQQGQIKKPLDKDEIEQKKVDYGIFPQLYYGNEVKLDGVVTYNGYDVYKLIIPVEGQENYEYYNAKTFLLEKSEQVSEIQGKQIFSVEKYLNYEEVSGIKVPHTYKLEVGPSSFTMVVNSVKYNDPVNEEDFK